MEALYGIAAALGFLVVLAVVLTLYGRSRQHSQSMPLWQVGISALALGFAMLVVVAASRGEYLLSEFLPTFGWFR